MKKILAVSTVLLLLIVMWSPTVQAAETRTVDGWIRIDPDTANMTVNYTWNSSDPSNTYLFNWNQTVDPFEQNNSLNGSFTGTFLPPIEFEVTKWVNTLTLCGLVKFKSTWIMSGSTESWWRIPCQGPGWGDSTNLTIWHIDSPATLNVTDTGTPNNISHPTKVFDQDFDMNAASLDKSVRYWNGTAWDRSFDSTWLRVGAQIHTDEFYLVRWVIHNNGDLYQIRFSATDQCEDRVFQTWVIHDNGTKEIYEADLDYSVLHILGMGYAVWGHEIVLAEGGGGPSPYAPSNQDDMTDALSPTGTGDGGIWDGDWNTTGGAFVTTDAVTKVEGAVSIKGYSISTNGQLHYTLDTGWDVTEYDKVTFSYYPVTSTVVSFQFWIYLPDGTGYRTKSIGPFTQGTWNTVELDLWAGWSSGGTPDYTDLLKMMFYFNSATSGQSCYIDKLFFTDTDIEEPSDSSAKITWNTELDEPITQGEYLTVMVPFLDVVDNSTNVLITYGTKNGSWATGFWVAADGPTDFGLESVQWDVAWGATDMQINMTIYNATRSLWIMDTNPEFDPDWTWEYNRYTVDDHEWAPDDYYFGGVPYHALQVTNGSWENTHPTGTYYLEGREVDPDQLMKKRQDSDSWLVELWLLWYELAARRTAAFTFAITGQWDKAWDVLNPKAPFPLDAPWYLGKYWFKSLDFLTELGNAIWAGLVWLYEVGVWIVENAGYIFAGIMTLGVLLMVIPLWGRFFKVIWGLIKFGWILAQDGVKAASDHAETFWADFVATSYARKGVAVARVAAPVVKRAGVRVVKRIKKKG